MKRCKSILKDRGMDIKMTDTAYVAYLFGKEILKAFDRTIAEMYNIDIEDVSCLIDQEIMDAEGFGINGKWKRT